MECRTIPQVHIDVEDEFLQVKEGIWVGFAGMSQFGLEQCHITDKVPISYRYFQSFQQLYSQERKVSLD